MFEFKYNCQDIHFSEVIEILKTVGMKYHPVEVEEKAFNNSYCVVFAFDGTKLAGFARVISDGVYQAALYDMAVHPDYQGKRLGKQIVEKIKKKLSGFNIILYASPGKEDFYQKLGFRKMLTGMALFEDAILKKEKGFIV